MVSSEIRDTPMRVLYFSLDYTPHDHRFLATLAETEHEVYYLRLQRGPRQTENRPVPDGVHIVRWAGGRRPFRWRDFPRLLVDFRRVVRRLQPDLIHAGPLQQVALFPALAGAHPLVAMSWGSDLLRDAERNAFYRWASRFVLSRADAFVGDCETVAQKALSLGFPREKMAIFPWGVDLTRFSPGPDDGLRARWGWQDAFVIIHTRSWEPLYGVEVMAQAFTRAARQEPRLRLMLLGGGSLAPRLREIWQRGGVLDRVQFVGQVSQRHLPRYYRAADLYLSASHSDGSSVSLMEALACGLPVAVSDIPSNQEWVRQGIEGWLFPDGDAAALARILVRAARNPREQLQTLGWAARRRAEERANWAQNVQRLLQLYVLVQKRESAL